MAANRTSGHHGSIPPHLYQMEKEFKFITKIVARDAKTGWSVKDNICKLGEEFGEFVQALNRTIGVKERKGKFEKDDVVRENIIEEGCSVIQLTLALLIQNGVGYEELLKVLHDENESYLEIIKRNERLQAGSGDKQ